MDTLRGLLGKLKDNLQNKLGGLSSSIGNAINDNKGFIQRGRFTLQPIQRPTTAQISNVTRNVLSVMPGGQMFGNPLIKDTANKYIENRYIKPIVNIPSSFQKLTDTKSPLLSSRRLEGGLGLLSGIASFYPDPVQDVILPMYDLAKGVSAYKIKNKNASFPEALSKGGIPSFTMENTPGFGDAISRNKNVQMVGNLLELPIMLGVTHKLGKSGKGIDELTRQTSKALKEGKINLDEAQAILGTLKESKTTPLPNIKIVGESGGEVGTGLNKALNNKKVRGLIESIKNTTNDNISPNVRLKVKGGYMVKPNRELMGEAQALLTDGGKIDFSKTKDLDKKVAATIQHAINLDRAGKHNEAAALFNNLSEHATELGRGVQAFSMLDKMTPQAIALSIAGRIKRYNETATRKIPDLTGEQMKLISEQVKKIDRLVGREKNIAINELSNTINSFIPSSLTDKFITVWKAGLLTSLRTHERNLIGNTIMGASEIAKDIPSALADKLMSLKTGNRALTFTTRGTGEGGLKGTRAAKDIIKFGYDPEESISKFDIKKINWGNNPVEQALKKYTDLVFNTLGGEDKPFWHSAFARSLYDQAGAEAMNVGKAGNRAFIEKLVKNPTEKMLTTATTDANYATFHDKSLLSGMVGRLKNYANQKWYTKLPSEILMPFTGVPTSIAGKVIDYSPLGLIKGSINAGKVTIGNMPELQRQAAQEIGRGVMGTALFTIGAYLVKKGLMTGQPKDTKESDLWKAQGKQPNSVFIGGKWRSINSVGPQNLIMLAGAKWQEDMEGDDKNMGKFATGIIKDQMDQTFLQGMMGPLNAVTDPQRYGRSWVGNTASSFIPNIIKDTAKSVDDKSRELNTVGDYVKAGIPGLRNTLTPRRDVLGNIIKQEPTGVNAFVDLFNSKTPTNNLIANEMGRLYSLGLTDAIPSKIDKNQTILGKKVKLTPEQLDRLESISGGAIKQGLSALIQSPAYQSMDDDQKDQAINKTIIDIRRRAKNLGSDEILKGGGSSISDKDTSQTSKSISDKQGFVDKNGNYKLIDFNSITPKDTDSKYESALKLKKAFTYVDDILDSGAKDEEKKKLLNTLGIDERPAKYYNVARQTDDIKAVWVMDDLENFDGKTRGDLINRLAGYREKINNEQILSNGVIDRLVDEGLLTKDEGKYLKNLTVKGGKVASSSRSKKIKIGSAPKLNLPNIKISPIQFKTLSAGATPKIRQNGAGQGGQGRPMFRIKAPPKTNGRAVNNNVAPRYTFSKGKPVMFRIGRRGLGLTG